MKKEATEKLVCMWNCRNSWTEIRHTRWQAIRTTHMQVRACN